MPIFAMLPVDRPFETFLPRFAVPRAFGPRLHVERIMSDTHLRPVLLLALALLCGAGSAAAAQGAGGAAAATRINVFQYAVDHPVENSAMPVAPSIGASVPAAVLLTPFADEKTYAYFYYDGRPVLVDRSTRSVVRIGQ